LRDRKEQKDHQRLPVADDVLVLLDDKSPELVHPPPPWLSLTGLPSVTEAPSGRASRTKSSSTESTSFSRFSSLGVPIAAILPSTRIEIRSQYSASSM